LVERFCGGYVNGEILGRSELQAMVGAQYLVRRSMNFYFGNLGGRYVASPEVGAQIGFYMDFPDVFGKLVLK
jgi:hypothetical protein